MRRRSSAKIRLAHPIRVCYIVAVVTRRNRKTASWIWISAGIGTLLWVTLEWREEAVAWILSRAVFAYEMMTGDFGPYIVAFVALLSLWCWLRNRYAPPVSDTMQLRDVIEFAVFCLAFRFLAWVLTRMGFELDAV